MDIKVDGWIIGERERERERDVWLERKRGGRKDVRGERDGYKG